MNRLHCAILTNLRQKVRSLCVIENMKGKVLLLNYPGWTLGDRNWLRFAQFYVNNFTDCRGGDGEGGPYLWLLRDWRPMGALDVISGGCAVDGTRPQGFKMTSFDDSVLNLYNSKFQQLYADTVKAAKQYDRDLGKINRDVRRKRKLDAFRARWNISNSRPRSFIPPPPVELATDKMYIDCNIDVTDTDNPLVFVLRQLALGGLTGQKWREFGAQRMIFRAALDDVWRLSDEKNK